MLRMTIPSGIPCGTPVRTPIRISEVGSQSGDSRNSTPLDALRVSGFLLCGSNQIQSNGDLVPLAAPIGIGASNG